MDAGSTRNRRSDAQANRERIVAAARAVFGAASDAPTRAVARAAGVGVATVYRHFPSREDLVDAVLRELVDGCERDLRAAVAHEDPRAGLAFAIRAFAARQAENRELGTVLMRRFPQERAEHSAQFDALVARAKGAMRDGLTVQDVRAGLMGIAGASRAAVPRLTEVVLAGILA
ncbi:TetR/AcrR family transcriptional regulator [Dactylosporangium sp. CS-047395]|uniref:TetR/AcrR family transcriptional regulator n=1 Tax=Dactylosporangium sp. CS-047395 TaxID=3239936 RepID=UPI003D8BB8A4